MISPLPSLCDNNDNSSNRYIPCILVSRFFFFFFFLKNVFWQFSHIFMLDNWFRSRIESTCHTKENTIPYLFNFSLHIVRKIKWSKLAQDYILQLTVFHQSIDIKEHLLLTKNSNSCEVDLKEKSKIFTLSYKLHKIMKKWILCL